MLLHAAVQKQIHNFTPSTWDAEKELSRDCLSVLAFCATSDRVASKFHEQLSSIYERIFGRENRVPAHGRSTGVDPGDMSRQHWETSRYLLHIPEHADALRVELSLSVFFLLCHPFEGPSSGNMVNVTAKQLWMGEFAQRGHVPVSNC